MHINILKIYDINTIYFWLVFVRISYVFLSIVEFYIIIEIQDS